MFVRDFKARPRGNKSNPRRDPELPWPPAAPMVLQGQLPDGGVHGTRLDHDGEGRAGAQEHEEQVRGALGSLRDVQRDEEEVHRGALVAVSKGRLHSRMIFSWPKCVSAM